MNLSFLYDELVKNLNVMGISMTKTSNGFTFNYGIENENLIVKLLLDFYKMANYNVLLLNSNDRYSLCIENQLNNDLDLLNSIKDCISSYSVETNYINFMDHDVKSVFRLFKQSFRYPGNFGIGVKNLEEVSN